MWRAVTLCVGQGENSSVLESKSYDFPHKTAKAPLAAIKGEIFISLS